MYLLIPIGIFVISLAGVLFVVGRKLVYLKKLTPEAISNPPSLRAFWAGFVPEIIAWFEKINWREYRVGFMGETEKLLRKIRLSFLKIDTVTHNLTMRLRRSTKHHEAILKKEEAEEAVTESIVSVPQVPVLDPKEEEQHLIMEIAKNPKDKLLYLRLGDVYLKINDHENAALSFKTVLDLDPENWYAKKKLEGLSSKPE
ncbi:MAG: hypothetical protein AAB483_02445 [Patescibacteria group bacterium]